MPYIVLTACPVFSQISLRAAARLSSGNARNNLDTQATPIMLNPDPAQRNQYTAL